MTLSAQTTFRSQMTQHIPGLYGRTYPLGRLCLFPFAPNYRTQTYRRNSWIYRTLHSPHYMHPGYMPCLSAYPPLYIPFRNTRIQYRPCRLFQILLCTIQCAAVIPFFQQSYLHTGASRERRDTSTFRISSPR